MRLENKVALILAAIGAVSILSAEAAVNWASGSCRKAITATSLEVVLADSRKYFSDYSSWGCFFLAPALLLP